MSDHPVPTRPMRPSGINHLVLNVRDMAESHAFWTEILGFQQVGELKPRPEFPGVKMRFYSGERGGVVNHHDVALVENRDLPEPPKDWGLFGMPSAINHIAVTMPDRETWLKQLEFMQARGVRFNMRIEHGMTHSLYINDPNGYGIEVLYDLPRDVWEGDIDAALNFAALMPTEGPDALTDRTTDVPVFRAQ